MKAKHWYDYLWVYAIIYFALGFFNILFAWLGMIDFLLPLIFAISGGNKFFCNHLCGRGQLFSKLGTDLKCSFIGDRPMTRLKANALLDVLQVVSLQLFDLFPDDVREHGVPDLSGRCGCSVTTRGH